MSFKELLKRIESSGEFKKFKKENPKAILYSAFFTFRAAYGNLILDSQQLDYLIDKRKIGTFLMANDQVVHKIDKLEKDADEVKALNKEVKLDLDEVRKIIDKEIKKQKITSQITEIIAILQRLEGKQIWNLIIVLSVLEMLRLHISMDNKILLNKKENFMNFMKVEKGKKGEKKD